MIDDLSQTIDDRRPLPKRKKQGELTGKQKRTLRGLGHHLSVVVQVGQHGVTHAVIMALDEALERHELVKAQIADERDGRADAAQRLADATSSVVAQELGKSVLFFRQREERSRFNKELERVEPKAEPKKTEKPKRKAER